MQHHYKILLADDDPDDCILFKDALDHLGIGASVEIAEDGEQLMLRLDTKSSGLPDLIFLDLNMPRKNGFQCLSEIKQDDQLKSLPVIIYSTSIDKDAVNLLYQKGAHYAFRKPGDFNQLKQTINKVLVNFNKHQFVQPPKEEFIIHP